ncbi:MAG: hypothetical protein JST12_09815 [Armatimonadetes bacterium]|nr:hypothetical protein [Armatimonadota bacterium]
MTHTIYASFHNMTDAERAIGALLDHGVKPKDVSLIANESHSGRLSNYSAGENLNLRDLEIHAKTGITTTTGADAESGALAGAGVGLGVGVVAALAAVFLPGIGIVLGGGALAIAIAAAAATTGAGVIAGGVVGFLKDQGVPENAAYEYHETVEKGGALIAIGIQGMLTNYEVESLLAKYHAENISRYSPALKQ